VFIASKMCLLARPSRALITVALASSVFGGATRADDSQFVASILNSNDNAVLKQSIQHFVDNNTFPDDETFITRLTTIVDDQNLGPAVREVGAFVLGKERERAASALPALERALEPKLCREPKAPELGKCWKLQRAAAEAIGRIHQSTPDVTKSLAQAQLRNPTAAVRAFAILAQGELMGGRDEIKFLSKNLDDLKNDVEIKSTIAYRLAERGPKAVEAVDSLANALNHYDQGLVEVSAWALGLIGPDAVEAINPLTGLLYDKKSASVRRVAATALQQISAENDESNRHEIVQDLSDALKIEPNLEAKTAMAVAIAELEDGGAGGASALFAALRSTDDRALQQAACIGIAKASPPPNPDVKTLTNVARAEYPDVKIAALSAIGHIHQQSDVAIPAIIAALAPSNKIRTVRIAAIEAMGQFSDLGEHASEAIRSLAISSQDPRTRFVAVRSLESVGNAYRMRFMNSTDRSDFSLQPAIDFALKNVQEASKQEPLNIYYKQSQQSLTSAIDTLNRRRLLERLAVLKPFAWPLALALVYAIWISTLYFVVLQTWPLALLGWNEFLAGLGQVQVLKILALKLRDVLLWNSYNDPRVLSAWIERHCAVARQTFVGQYLPDTRKIFLPLPIAVADDNDHYLNVGALRTVCSHKNFLIRIIGEGGVGKTTIAYQLALLALEGDSEKRLIDDRRMIPVVLERAAAIGLLKDVNTFSAAVRGKLRNIIRDPDPIPEWLCEKLLRDRRILVIIDGLSEMVTPAGNPLPLEPDFPAAALVVTSRNQSLWETVPHVDMRPLRVDSNHLTAFMNAYLGEHKVLSDDRLFEACRRLATMVGEKGITPLLARMFAEQLVGRTRGLPENIPDVVVGYVEALNTEPRPDQPTHPTIQRAAERAAWECCRTTFCSGYVRRDGLSEILSSCEGLGHEHLEFLENRLHLIRNIPPTFTYVEFSFDPIAEYLAGIWLARNLKSDQDWRDFVREAREKCRDSSSVRDFLAAVAECVRYIRSSGASTTMSELDALSQDASPPSSAKHATA
jgi:hypothetical protein